jgi:hypothetical protein
VISDVARAVVSAIPGCTAEEAADILLLAGLLAADRDDAQAHGDEGAREPQRPGDELALAEPEPPQAEEDGVTLAQAWIRGPGNGRVPALSVGLRGPAGIPGPLASGRVLSLFKRVRRPGRPEVDVDATVDATADSGRLTIVTRPRHERGLDVAVVVDASVVMRALDGAVSEFEELLRRTGAFRSVTRWMLCPGDVTMVRDASGGASAEQPPSRLIDPAGHRLVLVITDATAEHWYRPATWQVLRRWGELMPTAVIHVLPRQYRVLGPLGASGVAMRSPRPAAANSAAQVETAWWYADPDDTAGGMVPVPVVGMTPPELAEWARAVTVGAGLVDAVFASEPARPTARQSNAGLSADDRVRAFRARASRGAQSLARVLATAPELSLPLIRVLQAQVVGEAGASELAEVLVSGVLERVPVPDGERGEERFRFLPPVGELLQRGITATQEWDIFEAISGYLERHAGTGAEIRAFLAHPDGHEWASELAPFAVIGQSVAARLGLTPPPVEPARASSLRQAQPVRVPSRRRGSARGAWDAVVDVSNVCWSPYLPPLGRQEPVWGRLGLVMAAWWDLHGNDARLELVADNSLPRVLGGAARDFFELQNSGGIKTAAVADAEILRLAREGGLHVITRDHYIDHRAANGWIEQSPNRFHAWDTVDGQVRLVPLGIRIRSAQDVSGAREVKVLRYAAKLDARNQAHRKILQTRWRCPNAACRQAAQWQGQLLTWPAISPEGDAVCPSCRRQLVALGPRAVLHEVVVGTLDSGVEIARFPLEVDCPVIVGRGAAVKGIDLAMYAGSGQQVIDTVSRQHLMLRLMGAGAGPASWQLSVIDLNSTNGTTVQRWTGSAFDPARPVPASQETRLGTRDRVILGEAVLLRLSGKRYLAEPARRDPELQRPSTSPEATTVIRQLPDTPS